MEPIVIIDNTQVSGQPGVPVVVGLRIKNTGTRNTAYDLTVVGIPESWVSITPSQVRPKERAADAATSAITITPPTGSEGPAGAVPFGVKASSTVDGSSAVAEGILTIGGAGGLDVIAEATQKTGRWRTKFPIELHNSGNEEVRVALVPFDATDETLLEVDRHVVTLAPRATSRVTLKAKMRSPTLRGAPAVRPIVLAVHSHERGADMKRPGQPIAPGTDPLYRQVPLMLTQSPILSKGVMALGGLAVVALLAVVAYRNFLFKDHEPIVTAPTHGPTVEYEAQAGAISIRWEPVSGADGYLIQLVSETGTQPIGPLSSGETSQIIGDLLPGVDYEVTLTPLVGEQRGFSTSFTERPIKAELPAPTGVTATPTGQAGEYAVSWTFTGEGDVQFNIRVDGQVKAQGIVGTTTPIKLDPGKRQVSVEVFNVADPSRSGLSDAFAVDVAQAEEDEPDASTSPSSIPESEQAATNEDAATVQSNPFLVLLTVGFQTAEGGLEAQNALALSSSFEVLMIQAFGASNVVALPAAGHTIEFIGVGTGSADAQGWIVGAAFPSEADARALCTRPEWDTNPALASVKAGWKDGCSILRVSPK